ncbi:branched-chain amino acid ABC transporter permease [Orrella marina]|uniref:Branched-chain amino acid ABC transporter permease n=2 Tax=Orrella marina TaxID=2163011 RepID=A0A2R4XK64_9BURK|nr:branched-chain amino acid ABC transporter permease [Orrella marina]
MSQSLMETSKDRVWLRKLIAGLIMLCFCLVPVYSFVSGDTYVLTYFGRILVFALCALGLNLVLGFGAMASLGHAMYVGLGAYSVGILTEFDVFNGWVHLLTALSVSAVVALIVGWISLRTQGMAFIMITLAFAQLFFYVFVSLRNFGGDEGISLSRVSDFGSVTGQPVAVYLSILASVLLVLWATSLIVQSRFGLVLRATRYDTRRVQAVGTSAQPYRLVAYIISAQVCALGGFFMANLTGFVSPSLMSWMVSAELMVMVLLGGAATVFGPVAGAAALLLVEDAVKLVTPHWPLVIGPLILLMVLGLRGGLWGIFFPKGAARAHAQEHD